MKRILLFCIISSNTYGTNLTLNQSTEIKIEYDTKTEKVKILSKITEKNKWCAEEIKASKRLIKSATRERSGKVKTTFRCNNSPY